MIPKYFIQELLLKLDISVVIGHYVSLKKSGANLVGLCPFHSENSPSFTVSSSKKIYHCFGCGSHGDAITFVMNHLGLSFKEAVDKLALYAGMTIPVSENKDTVFLHKQKKEDLCFKIMSQAQKFYNGYLFKNLQAVSYLKKRGLNSNYINIFGIGWSGKDNNFLSKCFSNYNDDNLLVEIGLVVDAENGRRYDRFRERIMFPIRNFYGKIVGFGARTIDDNKSPKYLNSPETILFSKRRELYGLWEAKNSIRKYGYVIVVEGYMDVISLFKSGITNVVATLGTSVTSDHIKSLLSITNKIIFSFDGDKAGYVAAWRALTTCLNELKDTSEIRFLILDDAYDPDSYISSKGVDAFKEKINNSIPLSKFFINELSKKHLISEVEGRISYWNEANSLLKLISNNLLRIQMEKEIAGLLNMTDKDLIRLSDNNTSNIDNSNNNYGLKNSDGYYKTNYLKYNKKRSNILQFLPSLATHLLNLLMSNLESIDSMVGNQQLEIIDKHPDLKLVRDLILLVQSSNARNLNSLKQIVSKDSELYNIIHSFNDNYVKNSLPDPIKEWEDSLLLIEYNSLKKDIDLLVENGLTSEQEINKYKDLSKKIISIKKIILTKN
ncbi:DNA primase [Candidatus Kinetoplastibacterium desouzaii TCC079E]|uniref:DNA primase n=1 Tax=Candidatus Kinetoplastidibacterium desouzai TCC079E TaxID=1208919 RepID=M1L2F7_9PROT|nr:DNA primase [Candidatus Kinetoplastibacterium desouzaii]AGF46933.1 DNA primase [Candidatus Kinetoplastibacterium desouzaii TCC079E]